jgi:hypothetical protein
MPAARYTRPLAAAVLTAVTATLIACSAATSMSPTPVPVNPTSGETLYFIVPTINGASGQPSLVVGFPTNESGAVSPSSTISIPSNLTPLALATDSSGTLYVVCNQSSSSGAGPEILVYSSANTALLRTINLGLPSTVDIDSIAIDSTGQIYVATSITGQVEIFAANASGNATPIRTIQWDPTQFSGGIDLAVDSAGELFVLGYLHGAVGTLANPTEVVVYAPNAGGSAAPIRTIVGTDALLAYGSSSISVDPAGNLFALIATSTATTPSIPVVAEFAAGANGNAVPIKTITGNYNETSVGPTHLLVDASDNVYVFGQYINLTGIPITTPGSNPAPTPPAFVAVFPATATGTVTPSIQFTSTAIADGAFGFAAF